MLSAAFACVWLAVTVGFASEPWHFPAGFKFGDARDARLPDILERVRREHDLPALAAVSVASTGMVELGAVGLRAVGFRERVTTNDQWHLGSITKTMTATVAARLVDADNPPSLNPAGVVHASLQDVARFASAHLRGELGTAGFLPAKSFRRLHTPMAGAWAMDWRVETRNWAKRRWLYHSGSNGRWFAGLTLAPDMDFAVFAACNAAE